MPTHLSVAWTSCPPGAEIDPGHTDESAARIRSLTEASGTRAIVRAIKRLTDADLRQDPSSTLPLELAIVEAGLEPERAAPAQLQAPATARPTQRQRPAPAHTGASPAPPASARAAPARTPAPHGQSSASPAPAAQPRPARSLDPAPIAEADLPSEPAARLEAQWEGLTSSLRFVKGDKFNLKALLVASNGRAVSEDSITLRFPHASHKERMEQELEVPASRKLILDAFARVMGRPYDVRVETSGGANTGSEPNVARNSPLVRAAQAMGAQIVAETPDVPGDGYEAST